jgi:hypothetical protein
MTKSPNDQDPPDHFTDEEAFLEHIYEKFPWIDAVEEMLNNDAMFTGEPLPGGGLEGLLSFVSNCGFEQGRKNAQADMGEYIDHLESEALGAIRMVLDAATEEGDDEVTCDVCDTINWNWLKKVNKQFGRKNERQT